MQELSTNWYIILILIAFIAGYVDAIAGGGGMIQAPMLLLSGLHPVVVLAINKFASMTGTITATIKYAKHKKIIWGVAFVAVIPCIVASYIGSSLIMFVNEEVINWLILLSIPIAMIMLLKKRKEYNQKKTITKNEIIKSTAPIGLYDGFLGPGTGTYMAISMNRYLGLDFLGATATAKVLNLGTNFGATVAFIIADKVLWSVALPMALTNVFGGYIGTHYAIKGGEGFIKKFIIVMLIFMLVANIIKIFFSTII
ncbi:MAG: TSUP family transporter [Campylobacterota bacterium]|nr:TSUP family transporter [Campylobacterota bacterium]